MLTQQASDELRAALEQIETAIATHEARNPWRVKGIERAGLSIQWMAVRYCLQEMRQMIREALTSPPAPPASDPSAPQTHSG